jgi:hypothetical protein
MRTGSVVAMTARLAWTAGWTFAGIKTYGEDRWLGELAEGLRKKEYHPQAVRRVYIPKPDGKQKAVWHSDDS